VPNPPGVASLAQALLEARARDAEVFWLCHPAWTSITPFWERTLQVLDREPERLPLRWGVQAEARPLPRSWKREGYRLVLVGMPLQTSRDESQGRARHEMLHCLRLLHRACRPERPLLLLSRSGQHPLEARPGPALVLTTSHFGQARLDCTSPPTELGHLAGLTVLAAEEAGAEEVWVRRARALCAWLARGNWERQVRAVLPALVGQDWSWLDRVEVPDIEGPQASMVLLRRTLVADLEEIPVNLRRHALEQALQASGRTYGVGCYRKRGSQALLVTRVWGRPCAWPSTRIRLRPALRTPGWVHPSPDHAYSPPVSREDLPALLDATLQALERPRRSLVPRTGGLHLTWQAGEEAVGAPSALGPTHIDLEPAGPALLDSNSDRRGPSRWRVRGDFSRPQHPLRMVLEALSRRPSDDQVMESLLHTYREALFLPGERGLVHTLKGRLRGGGAGIEEALHLLGPRLVAFLSEWPWPAGLTGSEEEAREREILERLWEGRGSPEDLLWALEFLGDDPRRVGSLPPTVRERLSQLGPVAWLDDPEAPAAVVWPPTLGQLLEAACHNALEHAGGTGLTILCRRCPEGVLYAVRDQGPGLAISAASLLDRVLAGRRGGLFRIAEEVPRMRGEAWMRTVREGVTFSGLDAAPLRRRWLAVGRAQPPEPPVDWLEWRRAESAGRALDLVESRPVGWCDGFLLGADVSSADLDRLARGRTDAWKWYDLPRLSDPDEITQRPGFEVGFTLRALPDRREETQ
jgi:hypothetical protein